MIEKIVKKSLFLIVIFLSTSLFLPQNYMHSQSNLKIFEDIGGGSGASSDGSGSDNTFIYVAGGLLVAGVIAYALFFKKDNKNEEIDDSTTAVNYLTPTKNDLYSNKLDEEISSIRESFPVDIILGIKNDVGFIPGKTYLMGLSIRF